MSIEGVNKIICSVKGHKISRLDVMYDHVVNKPFTCRRCGSVIEFSKALKEFKRKKK